MIQDRAKYSSGEVAGITSRLILANALAEPVSYKNNSGERSSAKFCPVSGQEKSFGVCGLQFQMTCISLNSTMSNCNAFFIALLFLHAGK